MKKLFFFVFIFLFITSPFPVFAETEWTITDFHSDIIVQSDGKVSIKEKISVDFNSLEKHGIYRDIPYVYESSTGEKTYTTLDIGEVIQDNQRAMIETSNNGANLRIRIGDPDTTISGKHTYQISYIATGVLLSHPDYDELYWNVTGQDWEADIEKVSTTVTLPKEKIEIMNCFEGYSKSTLMCSISQTSPKTVSFASTNPLYPHQGITIGVGFTKGIVPLLTVSPPRTIFDEVQTLPSLITLLVTILTGCGTIFYVWMSNGRDLWYKTRRVFSSNIKEEHRPFWAYEPTLVEFESPEKLPPAILGVVMDEKADTLDVTATLVDLATRGFMTITEIPKKWLFGTVDYELSLTGKGLEKLYQYEKTLLNRLFSGNKEKILVSSLKKTFYDDLAIVKTQLYEEVVKKKLFSTHPETTRHIYIGSSIIISILGGGIIKFAFEYLSGPGVMFGIGVIISGIILLFSSRSMPRRSAYGRDVYLRAKGYRLFISGAEKYRQQFFEKKNIFNEVLPYAIIFGLTEKFAQSMKEMGLKPSSPSWYSGTRVFVPSYFVSDVNSFSKSLSSAIASTPSSSGSSGGSSGGGFGGGGGGSW